MSDTSQAATLAGLRARVSELESEQNALKAEQRDLRARLDHAKRRTTEAMATETSALESARSLRAEVDRLRSDNGHLNRVNLDGAVSETQLIVENSRLTRERDEAQKLAQFWEDSSQEHAQLTEEREAEVISLRSLLSALTGEEMRAAILDIIHDPSAADDVMTVIRQRGGRDG